MFFRRFGETKYMLIYHLLAIAVGLAMGKGDAQAAKNAEQELGSDEQTLYEQLHNRQFHPMVNSLQNDVSDSYNLTARFRSKGVHLSATDGSIDPFVQQAKLTDLDGVVTRLSDTLGYSVSVDGNIAVVGADGDENNRGSVYVFTHDGDVWTETAKLVPTDGKANNFFGHTVDVDGNTIVVGSIYQAYVFTHDGGTWTETARLSLDINPDTNIWTGLASVSVSDSTIVVSTFGEDDDRGSVYVFAYDGETWIETVELVAFDGDAHDLFGYSVSVDGRTIVVGAQGDDRRRGSVYVFTYDGERWAETVKLVAADGEAYDLFGQSVSISDGTIVVGAPRDGDKGRASGSVYVFTYDGGMWTETTKLTPNDGEAYDYFGHSISVDGRTIAVGTDRDSDSGRLSGSAYVFTYDGRVWAETIKLTASDGEAYDFLGHSISVSEGTIIVGAFGDENYRGSAYVFTHDGQMWGEKAKLVAADGNGYFSNDFGHSLFVDGRTIVVGADKDNEGRGSAYVFTYDGEMWAETAALTSSDGEARDNFGHSISVDGRTMIVSAPGDDDDRGSVYVFTYDGEMWAETAKLVASDGEANDHFGRSVSISGSTIIAGAQGNDRRRGAVYVFTYDGEMWAETAKLTASDGEARDSFGRSLSISGNTIVAGAQGDDRRRGAVYVFTYDGGMWTETAKLTAADGEAYDFFGHSVSVDGRTVVVGTDRDAGVVRFSGSAYVFTYDGEMWTETTKLIASDGEDHDLFGHSVDVSGRTIVIGAFGDSDNGGFSGSAYVFTYDGEMWTETTKLTAADGIANDFFGEAVSVDRGVVVVGAPGGDNRIGSAYVYRVPLVERADVDGDGVIGMSDFRAFAEAYGTTDLRFDFDEDGTVGFSDFLVFVSLYSESA